jgi:hypothetical protein
LDDLIFFQLLLAIRDALARLHVIFHAMPGADEVHFSIRKIQTLRRHVGTQAFLDFCDRQTLASRAALMQAEIAVGVKSALVPKHADLVFSNGYDAPVAINHF